MKKSLLVIPFLIAIIAISFINKPTPVEEDGINWMTWTEMQEAQKKEPRKIVVDVYTSWCGWCKKMDASTFTNPVIVEYVKQNFYAVKFDAETKETIHFNGRDFMYINQGNRGYNQLAAEILNGQLSYPTTVYFDEKLDEIFPVPGYQDPKMFETVLNFVATNSYKNQKWEPYLNSFKGKINE